MSAVWHIPKTTTYHEGGNLPLTTAFEMAVAPTFKAVAKLDLPSVSTMHFTLLMEPKYPPKVDKSRSTNGGLIEDPPSVNITGMSERPDYSEIGDRLVKVRTGFSDLSQRLWAERHNFSPTQYNNWERGTRRISVDAAEVLAERYGLSLDFIYRGRMDGLSETARKVL